MNKTKDNLTDLASHLNDYQDNEKPDNHDQSSPASNSNEPEKGRVLGPNGEVITLGLE
jgi:hypothetical protein